MCYWLMAPPPTGELGILLDARRLPNLSCLVRSCTPSSLCAARRLLCSSVLDLVLRFLSRPPLASITPDMQAGAAGCVRSCAPILDQICALSQPWTPSADARARRHCAREGRRGGFSINDRARRQGQLPSAAVFGLPAGGNVRRRLQTVLGDRGIRVGWLCRLHPVRLGRCVCCACLTGISYF